MLRVSYYKIQNIIYFFFALLCFEIKWRDQVHINCSTFDIFHEKYEAFIIFVRTEHRCDADRQLFWVGNHSS